MILLHLMGKVQHTKLDKNGLKEAYKESEEEINHIL